MGWEPAIVLRNWIDVRTARIEALAVLGGRGGGAPVAREGTGGGDGSDNMATVAWSPQLRHGCHNASHAAIGHSIQPYV